MLPRLVPVRTPPALSCGLVPHPLQALASGQWPVFNPSPRIAGSIMGWDDGVRVTACARLERQHCTPRNARGASTRMLMCPSDRGPRFPRVCQAPRWTSVRGMNEGSGQGPSSPTDMYCRQSQCIAHPSAAALRRCRTEALAWPTITGCIPPSIFVCRLTARSRASGGGAVELGERKEGISSFEHREMASDRRGRGREEEGGFYIKVAESALLVWLDIGNHSLCQTLHSSSPLRRYPASAITHTHIFSPPPPTYTRPAHTDDGRRCGHRASCDCCCCC